MSLKSKTVDHMFAFYLSNLEQISEFWTGDILHLSVSTREPGFYISEISRNKSLLRPFVKNCVNKQIVFTPDEEHIIPNNLPQNEDRKAFLDFVFDTGTELQYCDLQSLRYYVLKDQNLQKYHEIKPPDLECLWNCLIAEDPNTRVRKPKQKLFNSFPIFDYSDEEELLFLCIVYYFEGVFFAYVYDKMDNFKLVNGYVVPGTWSLHDIHHFKLDRFTLAHSVKNSRTKLTEIYFYHLLT